MKSTINKTSVKTAKSFFAFLFASMLLLTGCNKDGAVDANSGTAKIAGRIDTAGDASKTAKTTGSISGAVVSAVKINSNGTLTTISKNEVTTDAGGKFILEIDVNGANDVMIVAKKGDKEWKGIVTSEIKSGFTIYSRPLNEQTTLEANLFLKSRLAVYKMEAGEYISSSEAEEISSNSGTVDNFNTAVKAKYDAFAEAITKAEFGGNNEKLKIFESASVKLRAELDRNLYNAETDAAVEGALSIYYTGIIRACINAGLSAETYYNAIEISQRVFLNNLSVSSSVKFNIKKKLFGIKARVLVNTTTGRFTALGATDAQLTAITSAGLKLSASINAASADDEIKSAFDAYIKVVADQLKISAGISAGEMTSIESGITEFKLNFKSSLAAAVSAGAIINAYTNFYIRVKEKVETVLKTGSETKTKAVLSILVLIHFNS